MERVDTMVEYIKIDDKGVTELIKFRRNPDNIKDILIKYSIEDWIPNIVESYDAVALALAEEIIRRHPRIEKKELLKKIKVVPVVEVVKVKPPKKVIQVSGYKDVKGYKKSSPGRYQNRERVKLFISSRITMGNKKLTMEYNEWAMENDYKLRTMSAISTLKSRVKRGKW